MRELKYFRLVVVSLFVLWSVSLFPGEQDCFTIIVGKKASASGFVMVAHNEDDAGENFFVNVHKISSSHHSSSQKVRLKNNAEVAQVEQTQGFLWFHIPGAEFGDSYINQKGVVITSNACRSREDQSGLTDGGIGFMLRRLVAERASSAREAVKIAGQLIKKYGYYSSGRCYAIADSTEGWLLQVVKGKHWIAQRVSDMQVAVMANCYTITTVDLKNEKKFLGSKDIVDYAIKRGWYQRDRDGEFNFARVYTEPGNIKSKVNALRQWRGINLLSKKKYKMGSQFPFSFIPRKAVKLNDLFKVLRDHYEGTEYDLTDDYKKGSPNSTKNRTICTESTRYSFVAILREKFPVEIAHCIWVAFRRPDTNAFSPWYVSISMPPEGYTRGSSDTALQSHFKQPEDFFKFNADYAYWNFAKLSDLVDENYKSHIKVVRKEWKNFEDYTAKRQKKMEKEFVYLLEKNKNVAVKIITNFIHKLEYRKWFLTSDLINQLGIKKN